MPGFNIVGPGLQNQKNSLAEPRRKHRWLLTDFTAGGTTYVRADEFVYLQKANRPTFKYDEAEMHHDQEVAYFAGKQSWEPLNLGWYDIEQDKDVSLTMAKWLNSITSNFFNNGGAGITGVAKPAAYKGQFEVWMTSGEQGTPNEKWKVYNAWPQQTNWGELDYTTSDIAMIEVTLRYDRAVKDGTVSAE